MTLSKTILVASLWFGLSASTAVAQATTLSADVAEDWKAQREVMMRIADAMPEDKFRFKATPPVNTTDMTTFGLKASTKADYVKVLADSFDYGDALLKEFSDAALAETVKGPPWMGPSTRVRMIYDAISHCQDIYGQMAVYLRLNGIVPPASLRGGV